MKKNLPANYLHFKNNKPVFRNTAFNVLMTALLLIGFETGNFAQGTWSKIAAIAPAAGGGAMLLLSDGSVICKSFSGGTDGIGNIWTRLTPDIKGSYVNGTWSQLPSMFDTRLYFSSQVLKDGRVYVAGGEYGSGGSKGETYNPLTNTWTQNGIIGSFVSDANSEILENGNMLQALVSGSLRSTKIYNPTTNTYSTGPTCIGIHNESTWIKLADGSILMVDRNTKNSERYIPSLNQWVADAVVPVSLYDPFGLETGAAVLLPNGRGFFIGSLGHTAYYTPSGNNSPGTWAAGPDLPNGQGQPDAPAAMMVDGNVLLTCSPAPTASNHFPIPTSFYVFNYLTNTYTRINGPDGALTTNVPVYTTTMIDLPDGSVLFSYQNSPQYYAFKPSGAPLASGKPKLNTIKKVSGTTYRVTGTLFNGISEGANYGDDWQMNTNYPLLRITMGTNVYYARSFNWNSTGVRRGSKPDTFYVTPPAGLPHGTLQLQVVANGIASDPKTVNYFGADFMQDVIAENASAKTLHTASIIYPNPSKNNTMLQYYLNNAGNTVIKLYDLAGKQLSVLLDAQLQAGTHELNIKTQNLSSGNYIVKIISPDGNEAKKLIIE